MSFRGLLLMTLAAALPAISTGQGVEALKPGADWCTAANALNPGRQLVLAPGDYPGPCTIRTGGRPGGPIVIMGADPSDPPRIVYMDSRSNVIDIAASHVTLRGLAFGPTLPDVDAIKIKSGGTDVTVEDCTFTQLGGQAISSLQTSERLVIRRNEITRSKATAIYVGCHDGAECQITDALIEGNYIDGVDAPGAAIGYGMQVKLNSTAVIRDNVVLNTKGPPIMVYGSRDPARTSLIERNFVAYSRTASGIVIGGGPAIVRNNISVGAAGAGIGLEDYGGRGLLRGIVVAQNTVYAARQGGVGGPRARLEAKVLYNAVHAQGPLMPPPGPGVLSLGNVDCRLAPCFLDPVAFNFAPILGSLLLDRIVETGGDLAGDDFFGNRRMSPSSAGAVESGSSGIVHFGRRLRPS